MRGGIAVGRAIRTAFQTATTSSPDTWKQTKTILFSPWKDIANRNDCTLTNSCKGGVITTPMSVVDKAYSNVPKNLRSPRAIEDDKHLTALEKQTYENLLLADTVKLDRGF